MKRKRKVQKNTDQQDMQAISFAEAWQSAISRRDFSNALKARQQAEPLFKKNPDLQADPPRPPGMITVPKSIYIDWQHFVNFLDECSRSAYLESVETNQWPPKTDQK